MYIDFHSPIGLVVKCKEWHAMACKRRGFDSRSEPVFFFFCSVLLLLWCCCCCGVVVVFGLYFFFLTFVVSPYVQLKKKKCRAVSVYRHIALRVSVSYHRSLDGLRYVDCFSSLGQVVVAFIVSISSPKVRDLS